MANPLLAGEIGEFDDFLQSYSTQPGVQKNSKQTEHELNTNELREQVRKAENILNNYKPVGKVVK